MAHERILGRQSRCENEMSDVSQKCKQISRSIAELSSESAAKLKNSRVLMGSRAQSQDLRSELSRFDASGILNYQMSLTDINVEGVSNHSSGSFD